MKKRLTALMAAAALMLTACSSSGGSSAPIVAAGSAAGADTAGSSAWSAYTTDKSEADGTGSQVNSAGYADFAGDTDAFEPAVEAAVDAGSGSGYAYFAEGSGSGTQAYHPVESFQPGPQAGVLTAGRLKDNEDWTSFSEALKREDWQVYQRAWNLSPKDRLEVYVTAGAEPLAGCSVTALGSQGETLWRSVTDVSGKAYIFPAMFGSGSEVTEVTARCDGRTESVPVSAGKSSVQINFGAMQGDLSQDALDLMLVMDTTGSMSDELDYLSAELVSVVDRVLQQNPGLDVRTSVNFYRDTGDEYVTRNFPFTDDAAESQRQLQAQYADGGGDYEEALDQALFEGVNDHDWRSPVRILFLVMDAPPHNRGENYELKSALAQAAAEGIRIVPVASSGVDEESEYLMRTLAAGTGGQYLFLTDDSEVGNDHKDPTAEQYETGHLNDLMVRVIQDYLAAGSRTEMPVVSVDIQSAQQQ